MPQDKSNDSAVRSLRRWLRIATLTIIAAIIVELWLPGGNRWTSEIAIWFSLPALMVLTATFLIKDPLVLTWVAIGALSLRLLLDFFVAVVVAAMALHIYESIDMMAWVVALLKWHPYLPLVSIVLGGVGYLVGRYARTRYSPPVSPRNLFPPKHPGWISDAAMVMFIAAALALVFDSVHARRLFSPSNPWAEGSLTKTVTRTAVGRDGAIAYADSADYQKRLADSLAFMDSTHYPVADSAHLFPYSRSQRGFKPATITPDFKRDLSEHIAQLATASARRDTARIAWALRWIGNDYLNMGVLDSASSYLEASLNRASEIGAQNEFYASLCRRGELNLYLNKLDEAEHDFEETEHYYNRAGTIRSRAWATVNLAKLRYRQENYKEVKRLTQKIINLPNIDKDDAYEADIYHGVALVSQGQFDQGLPKMRSALQQLAAFKSDRETVAAYRLVAQTEETLGHRDEARATLLRGQQLADSLGMRVEYQLCLEQGRLF